MEKEEYRLYEEVRCDYRIGGSWIVKGWREGETEGEVVATIDAVTGNCFTARDLDDLCKRVIEGKREEIKAKEAETLAKLFNNLRLTDNQ